MSNQQTQMHQICDFLATQESEPCPNPATKIFFDWFSGYEVNVCDEHFEFLRRRAINQRGGKEQEIPFNEHVATIVEGREY